jgi:cation:H+ antiporter
LRYNRRNKLEEENEEDYSHTSLQKGIIGFIISGIIIVFSGRILANTGNEIAIITGLGSSFVGSFLIAITTSLPELVATFTAAKMGAFDMAIGNILGANVMNILIIFLTDLFYVGNPVLSSISIENGITGLFGICLSAIAIIGIIYRSKKSVFTLGYDSWAIVIGYILIAFLLFNIGIVL